MDFSIPISNVVLSEHVSGWLVVAQHLQTTRPSPSPLCMGSREKCGVMRLRRL